MHVRSLLLLRARYEKEGHRCAIRNGSLVPKTPMSPRLEAITHSSKNAERRMEQENARTLRVNSERNRERKEKDREVTKGTISLMSRDYVRLKRSTDRGERRRDGEGEALLPIVVRTDINVGKKAREEG